MAIAIDFHVHPATREATEALAGPPEQTSEFFHGAVRIESAHTFGNPFLLVSAKGGEHGK